MEHIPQSAKPHLRAAVSAALEDGDDAAAMAILQIITGSSPIEPATIPSPPAQLALPESAERSKGVIEGPPRDYHYWVDVIRQTFIPFLTGSGRHRFTSSELLTWMEHCSDLLFTSGDLESARKSHHPRWRERVGDALTACKSTGVLTSEPGRKVYEVQNAIYQAEPAFGWLNRADDRGFDL